jgi:UDP-N-acetyl-2-amino-2-deoxyglucuronate dehydrogenase
MEPTIVPPTFALVGAAGYIAPRHLRAMKDNNGVLVAALDPSDSVGIIDSYFPDARFFVEYERFDRYLNKLQRQGNCVNYVSICSPNYLHDAHVRFALRGGSDAICEKPLVLNPWNIDALADMERDTGRRAHTILQLRLHPAIIALKDRIASSNKGIIHEVDLTYITSRGRWYYVSWKGDDAKSGGIATNIGVHFFDMLSFVFGPIRKTVVHHREVDSAAGFMEFEKARVRWFLSINESDVPVPNKRTFRSITVDGEEVEFTDGFTELHSLSYLEILAGRGFPLDEARSAIEAVARIRSSPIELNKGDQHPQLLKVRNSGRYKNVW